jgi:hypothetical protein
MHAPRSQSYPIFKESKSVPFRYSLSSEWKRFCRDSQRVEKRIRLFPSKRNGRPYSPRPSPAIKPPPGRSPTSGATKSAETDATRSRSNSQLGTADPAGFLVSDRCYIALIDFPATSTWETQSVHPSFFLHRNPLVDCSWRHTCLLVYFLYTEVFGAVFTFLKTGFLGVLLSWNWGFASSSISHRKWKRILYILVRFRFGNFFPFCDAAPWPRSPTRCRSVTSRRGQIRRVRCRSAAYLGDWLLVYKILDYGDYLVVFYILLKEVPLFRSHPLKSHLFFSLLIGLYCLSGTVIQ